MAAQEFDIWVEKHRPSTLKEYVFKDEHMKQTVYSWLENKGNKKIPFPHLLLAGQPGTGKTSLSKIILNEFNIHRADILELNASRETGIDTIRQKVINFASTYSFGDYKVILLDEADRMSVPAQDALKSEMEIFADSCRFILTCNEIRRITPALKSRLQTFTFDALDMDNWVTRLVEILMVENISFEVDDLQPFIDKTFPDLRKCINLLDQHTRDKKLYPLSEEVENTIDYMDEVMSLFQKGNILEARTVLTKSIRESEYENVYRWMYNNLHYWGDTDIQKMSAIVIIAKGLCNHTISADSEINLSSVLVELAMLKS